MAGTLCFLLHFRLVEPRTKFGLSLSDCSTPCPVILCCHFVTLREKHSSANVFQNVFQESAQSGTDGGGEMLYKRERLFADARCSSLESVPVIDAAAHK